MGFNISTILGDNAGALAKNINDIVHSWIQTPGDKAELLAKQESLQADIQKLVISHEEKVAEFAQQELETYMGDVQSARESNTQIQLSDKASWLSKNVAYLLDITFTISFLFMLALIAYHQVPVDNKELFYTGFGALGTYVSQILGFHRGSSKGSEEKTKALIAQAQG